MQKKNKKIKCAKCEKTFNPKDHIVKINDLYYHRDTFCINIEPIQYGAFIDNEFIGIIDSNIDAKAQDHFPDLENK